MPPEDQGHESPRNAVLEYIREQLGNQVSVVLSTKAVAEALHLKPATVSYYVRRLDRDGLIHTQTAGRLGTTFSIPVPGTQSPSSKGAERIRSRSESAAARPSSRAKGTQYCPWCGAAADTEWKYCMFCGEEIPSPR